MSTEDSQPSRMTRADLYDWCFVHGCLMEEVKSWRAKLVKVVNNNPGQNFGRFIFLNLPNSHDPVYDYTVCKVCSALGIELPAHVHYIKPIHDRLDKSGKI
jgi:hypothetical protein